jgi:hypothetical protein
MFVLVEKPVFWWPVKVATPDPATAGKIIEQEFDAQFEALSIEDAKKLQAGADQSVADGEAAFLKRVVLNWRGIVAEDKSEVHFSAEALDRAMRFTWFRAALYSAYLAAIRGEARVKN